MAYCRISEDSDIYMYPTHDDTIICCGCLLEGVDGTEFIFRKDALAHLRLHRTWGHRVPGYLIKGMVEEVKEYGNKTEAGEIVICGEYKRPNIFDDLEIERFNISLSRIVGTWLAKVDKKVYKARGF